MLKSELDFSIIIPTYTGVEHIEKCFQSILDQEFEYQKPIFEVVIVIDGPNGELRQIIDNNKPKFKNKGVNYEVFQFKENQGRFNARLKGAKSAHSNQLLFVDDRVAFDKNYIGEIIKSKKTHTNTKCY